MHHNMNYLGLIFLAATVVVQAQTWYPSVDESTQWSVGAFYNGGELQTVTKKVSTGPSTTVDKSVFGDVALWGFVINGGYYYPTTVSQSSATMSTYTTYYGTYDVGSNWRFSLSYYLYKNGRFYFTGNWITTGGKVVPPTASSQVVWRIDYDLGTAGMSPELDDISEFSYNASGVDQWVALDKDFSAAYPVLDTTNSQGIERNAYCRLVDGTSATTQFYATIWPWAKSERSFYFMNFGNDELAMPPASLMTSPLQDVATNANYQQYAYNGRNQVVYATVTYPSASYSYYSLLGKVYQKPNGRSLQLTINQMTGAYDPDLSATIFDGNPRTIGDALNDLTGSRWVATHKTNIANPYGTNITYSQMHDFMLSSRNVSPTAYNTTNRDNFRDYFVDASIVNCLGNGSPGLIGVMFDYPGYDNNGIEREGCAIFWPAITYNVDAGANNGQQRWCRSVVIHEIGHCFNLNHTWGSCGTNYNAPADGGNCNNGTIMTYSLNQRSGRTWAGTGTLTWDATTPVNTNNQNTNWYQNAPESWMKPGRYGTWWSGSALTTAPTYYQY